MMCPTHDVGEDEHLELFYIEPEKVKDGWFVIAGEEFHHASRVLRKRRDDYIVATDGKGMEYESVIRQVMADRLVCEVQKIRRRPREPFISITLIAGMLKGHRFSTMIEKATEIGVHTIIPVMSEYAETEGNQNKVRRWRGVAKSAMKQSGRSILPDIEAPRSFEDAVLQTSGMQVKLIAHPCRAARSLNVILDEEKKKSLSAPIHSAVMAIGPEGGFSSHEIGVAMENKFECISLGPRRLRSETAACVALTFFLFYLEGM